MAFAKRLIDELIATSGPSLIGPDGLVKERQLAHGTSRKTLKGEAGEMTIAVPRDRNGTFEPERLDPESHCERLRM